MSIAQLRHSHNRRHEIAQEVIQHLEEFEGDLARVLSSGSRLVGYLPVARTEATLSPVVGQDAIGYFVSSLGLISEAMRAATAGHVSLGETGDRFRIAVQAGGDKDVMPHGVVTGSAERPEQAS
jgi:hypothetical protein